MTFQTFKTSLCDLLTNQLGSGYELSVQEVTKNNHVILDGLMILAPNSHVAPTIYLNSFYDDYQEGKSIATIAENIYDIYQNNQLDESFSPSIFQDFQNIKDRIAYKLIHFEKNKELLKDIPHIPYLDLAIVFYCILDSHAAGNATFMIKNCHLSIWQVSDQYLYETAIHNTPKLLPDELMNMTDLIQDYLQESPNSDECPMYVLSNKQKLFGASCILYQGLLLSISERFQSNLYLLPSSVHEFILIPASADLSFEDYNEMIQEVNRTQLSEEEILSDHAYFYSKDEQKLFAAW